MYEWWVFHFIDGLPEGTWFCTWSIEQSQYLCRRGQCDQPHHVQVNTMTTIKDSINWEPSHEQTWQMISTKLKTINGGLFITMWIPNFWHNPFLFSAEWAQKPDTVLAACPCHFQKNWWEQMKGVVPTAIAAVSKNHLCFSVKMGCLHLGHMFSCQASNRRDLPKPKRGEVLTSLEVEDDRSIWTCTCICIHLETNCFSVQSFEETTNKYRQHDKWCFVHFIFVRCCNSQIHWEVWVQKPRWLDIDQPYLVTGHSWID